MSLADWMIPELSVGAALELENSKRVLRKHAESSPDQVAAIACSVMEQWALQQSILRNATRHIAELEMTQFLAETSLPPGHYYVSPTPVSWLPRLLLRWCGLAQVEVVD